MNLERLRNLPVSVLLGGHSAEREISLLSGTAVADALAALGARVTTLDTATPDWWRRLEGTALAFVALHGPGGEDGVVQGLLETMGIPYTGSGVLASALAMDKTLCKKLWGAVGLPTPPFAELSAGSDWQAVMDQLGEAFVKPATGGSSVGTHRVASASELASAFADAAGHGAVIAERLVQGPEFTVAVLDDKALPAIRVETDSRFYDYQAKYHSDTTRYLCPCGLDAAGERELAELALAAFRVLGCRAWGRVDVMQDVNGAFFLLEVNTVPGMTSHSLVPMAAKAAGLGFDNLVGQIACLGLAAEEHM
ncbi:MAG: D-alanine--D-alanine ligase [Halieaceae bacterium]|jgi:D-alanine-D-alanine ligase|nr:D-alanine--D-alanine ligase [Halieaceae bacterium]